MNDTEIWKNIPEWEGYYSVSTFGRVRSEDREIIRNITGVKEKRKGTILKPWVANNSGKGYLMVSLCKGTGIKLKIGVHRLVLWAFIGKQKKGIDVRHLDGDCKNNRLINLCYGTRRENCKDAVGHLTMVRPQKLTKENVIEICAMGKNKISSKIVAEKFNVNRNTITEIWRGEIWCHITHGILPVTTYHRKHDRLSEEHKKILFDGNLKVSEISEILKINRHTVSRWRKRFRSV